MLEINDFQPVTIDDKSLFDKHYEKYPPIHSDNVFTTLVSWMEYANYHFAFKDNNLIIYSNIENNIRFRPPSGKLKKELFDEVINLSKKQNSDYPFGVINLEVKEWLEKKYPKMNFVEHRNFFDYVYLSNDLADLKGSSYSKIRNRLNKFKKNYEYNVEKISKENINEVREFLKRWCLWKDCESDKILENEKKAILFSIKNYFKLKLSGIIIRINDTIESISVFEKMNENTAVIHYEKGSPDYDGIYKAINQESAKILENDNEFINRESDMGIPGLRKAKLSYRPHHMVEVFHINRNNITSI
jgi:hypothetical protein